MRKFDSLERHRGLSGDKETARLNDVTEVADPWLEEEALL